MQERIRDLHVRLPCLRVPRWSNLVIVLNDVLVRAVKRDRKGDARAARCGFETVVGGNHVVSQNAAVAPAADSQRSGSATPILITWSTPARRS